MQERQVELELWSGIACSSICPSPPASLPPYHVPAYNQKEKRGLQINTESVCRKRYLKVVFINSSTKVGLSLCSRNFSIVGSCQDHLELIAG